MEKMDPKTDLSQFHHCDDCEGGLAAVAEVHEIVHDVLSQWKIRDGKKLSPRECVMTLMSCLCDFAAQQEDPDAAMEQAAETMKKLFDRGRPHDPRRESKDPTRIID